MHIIIFFYSLFIFCNTFLFLFDACTLLGAMLPKWRISYDVGYIHKIGIFPEMLVVPENMRAQWVDGVEQRARSEVACVDDTYMIAKRFDDLVADRFPEAGDADSPTLCERWLHITSGSYGSAYWRLSVLEHEAAHVCRAICDMLNNRGCRGSIVTADEPHNVWDFGRRIRFYEEVDVRRAFDINNVDYTDVRNVVEYLIAQAPALADTASKILSKVLRRRCGLGLHDAQCWVGEEFPATRRIGYGRV